MNISNFNKFLQQLYEARTVDLPILDVVIDDDGIVHNGEEADLRQRLHAPALRTDQDLYVSTDLKTGPAMVKDEDVCLHCGLCAERCPTGAWDMQKFLLQMTHAGPQCRDGGKAQHRKAA